METFLFESLEGINMLKESARRFITFITPSWRFTLAIFVIARGFYALWSFTILSIYPLAVQNIELNNMPLVSVFSLRTSQRYLYLRQVGEQILTFGPLDMGSISDAQTGSTWDVKSAKSIKGPLQGQSLISKSEMMEDVLPYHGVKPFPIMWLAMWQRFDANWYLSIAEHGYGRVPGDLHFPPVFPLLIWIVNLIIRQPFVSGLLVTHIATLFMLRLFYDLLYEWMLPVTANRAIIYFMLFPTSFFLFSVYSESVFLIFVLLSFLAVRKKSWAWSGLWIFCAILTRIQGVALIPVLLYLLFKDRPFLRKPAHWLSLLFPFAAGLIYLFMRQMGGEGNILPTVEAEWHAHLVLPWETYWYALRTLVSGQMSIIDFLNWLATTLFILVLALGWRKLPMEYTLFAVGSLLIMLTRIVETQPLISMTRYVLSLFPVFILFGIFGEKPVINRLIVYPAILLNFYLSAQFWLWGFVA